MNLFEQMKNATKSSIILAHAKQAEKSIKKKEIEDKKKAEEYDKNGIPYCPRCYAINLKTNKKKYVVGSKDGKAVLFDKSGEVIGLLSSRNVEVVCTCCGYKWKTNK